MKSVVELVRYSLTSIPGVNFVLTEHLCQLEAFFGRQWMSCGRNVQEGKTPTLFPMTIPHFQSIDKEKLMINNSVHTICHAWKYIVQYYNYFLVS